MDWGAFIFNQALIPPSILPSKGPASGWKKRLQKVRLKWPLNDQEIKAFFGIRNFWYYWDFWYSWDWYFAIHFLSNFEIAFWLVCQNPLIHFHTLGMDRSSSLFSVALTVMYEIQHHDLVSTISAIGPKPNDSWLPKKFLRFEFSPTFEK